MDKRKPTLADRFLAARDKPTLVSEAANESIRNRIRGAKQFVLDDAAADHIGRLMRDVPDLLIPQMRFARAPFERAWIEFDASVLWKAHNGAEPDDKADSALGVFIDGNSAYTVIGGTIGGGTTPPVLSPIAYDLNTPWGDADDDDPVRQRIEMSNALADLGLSPLTLQHFYWGRMFPSAQAAGVRLFEHSLRILPLRDARLKSVLPSLWDTANGELRNILTILLMLNRPSLTRVVREQAKGRGFIGNKLAPYFAHSVVTIDLDPKPALLRLTAGAGGSKRRHEVRGHWCHDAACRASPCAHDWRPHPAYAGKDDPTDPDHWLCDNCGGKRWWRAEHARGDAGKGFSIREGFNVTVKNE